jgi:hypothetical protein
MVIGWLSTACNLFFLIESKVLLPNVMKGLGILFKFFAKKIGE